MSRIYINQPLQTNATISLTEDLHHYLKHVLRMKSGDPIVLFNGSPEEFKGTIQNMSSRETVIELTSSETVAKESPLELVVAQGIPKGKKMDELIARITELGVSSLVPLVTDRTAVKSPSASKIARWRKIAIQSSQQTGRTNPPTIHEPHRLNEFFTSFSGYRHLLFYELEDSKNLKSLLTSPLKKVSLIIGSEGGFTPDEVELAQQAGADIVSLGKRILRTETVAPAVTAILQHECGDLNRL